MKTAWNGTVLAESEQTIMLEVNHYFPADSVERFGDRCFRMGDISGSLRSEVQRFPCRSRRSLVRRTSLG
jgi:hypothetical protein